MNELTIPEAAMPVVEVLRRDVARPTAKIVNYGTPRFECGKCPMGLHPSATHPTPVNRFRTGSPMYRAGETARWAFFIWWDNLNIKEARRAVDLIWPEGKSL